MAMIMVRKQTAILLVAVLAAMTVLTACASGNNQGNSGAPGNSASDSRSAQSDGAAAAETAAAGDDSKSNTVKEEPAEPVQLSMLTSHMNAAYPKQLIKTNEDPFIKELSRLSGTELNIEFLGHAADFDQQLTVRFASNKLADLVRTPSISHKSHPGAVEEGVFLELGALIDQYGPNIKQHIPPEAWGSPDVSYDGKIYGIPAIGALPAAKVVYIRQDWLDKLGMEQPTTVDEYLAFFEAVKTEDMNGDGDPGNEYGLYVRESLFYADLFFMEFGVSPHAWHLSGGELIPDIIRPEMKEAIAFWKMLYDKGYINPNLFTNSGADWSAGIKQGLGGVWVHSVLNYSLGWAPEVFVNQPDANVEMIAPPMGPKGQGALSLQYNNIYYVWVIPASSKHAEAAVKFLNWAWSDEADRFFLYGVEGLSYEIENNEIKWNQNVTVDDAAVNPAFYQRIINPRGDGVAKPEILKFSEDADMILKGVEIAKNSIIYDDSLNMPALKAFETNPELAPGNGYTTGGLFLDMFAKVVTGKEELDSAFDSFVQEWRRRGGDEAIKGATQWYNSK